MAFPSSSPTSENLIEVVDCRPYQYILQEIDQKELCNRMGRCIECRERGPACFSLSGCQLCLAPNGIPWRSNNMWGNLKTKQNRCAVINLNAEGRSLTSVLLCSNHYSLPDPSFHFKLKRIWHFRGKQELNMWIKKKKHDIRAIFMRNSYVAIIISGPLE